MVLVARRAGVRAGVRPNSAVTSTAIGNKTDILYSGVLGLQFIANLSFCNSHCASHEANR